ncbi:Putative ring-cleaving dioxygenase MhqO [Bacillus rhizoplanae]|uniref:Ring-cleaving dioxygenase MhqO n=1 Tax=Bacillus rhizoplanae TaxID=2880966 RepID=A0ABM8YGH2_9BACI|nr:ring-cleaving dioxygenase [Bacillus rhizoplanae]CAG9614812.1 Putative ring-cleaving dioxygenase MhqO [Bacillus rhizoplanae]
MPNKISGIHHISAMVNDAQRTIDFYAGVLGLRLIKKTINFDRPEVYHLYFGNASGEPGTVITFFPWPKQLKGRIGTGQVGVTGYMIPTGSMPFWEERLKKFNVEYVSSVRFGETYLQFQDPDGLQIELVEREGGPQNTWSFGGIRVENAIQGFSGATLYSAKPHQTAELLEHAFGLECIGQETEFLRFQSESEIGNTIDIKLTASVRGLMGAGTVHHIAWRAKNEEEHQEWWSMLKEKGYYPTEILDRNYFKALYFHEAGGILFEIATDSPGFTVDESIDELGEKLMLPSWLEEKRNELEQLLPSIEVRGLEGDK